MLNDEDSARLRQLIHEVRNYAMEASFVDGAREFTARWHDDELDRILVFDHAAMLVFPDSHDQVGEMLRHAGFDVSVPVPSVVVRQRLAERYQVSADRLDVRIIRGSTSHDSGGQRGVEIFSLLRHEAVHASEPMVRQERERNTEGHLAFTVAAPESGNYELMRRLFHEHLSMRPDGGGYNPHDDAASGGRSVLYFSAPPTLGRPHRHPRVELTCAGHYPEVVATHLRSTGTAASDEHDSLLALLTGHWAARAVHVAAELGIADVLAEEPATAATVADRTRCDPAAVPRLLRYLTHLGVLERGADDTYRLSAMGALLRSTSPFSDLVRMYGREFYEAWGELAPAVRTGRSAFSHRYGMEHFEYFSQNHDTARTFDRSMEAVTNLVAEGICDVYDFPPGTRMLDVGGGNGALLRILLRRNPAVAGVVLDRDHVADTVSAAPAEPGAGRLSAVAGDFFTAVPGGYDTYLLSRILHDWDDEDCLRILKACRAACGPEAALLVLERVLPDHGDPPGGFSLALPWDMQMLAVTGGRERSRVEYDRLLVTAGFRLDEIRPLPVDMNLLVARPA